jgi:hypothetical protein
VSRAAVAPVTLFLRTLKLSFSTFHLALAQATISAMVERVTGSEVT